MANLRALRDYLIELMQAQGVDRPTLSVNALFEALQRSSPSGSPVSRTTLYAWLGGSHSETPSPALLECIPVLSQLFGISEYEFYHVAEILPPEIETAASLLAAANDYRHALSMATRALNNAGLSSDGVAVVVDRVSNFELDFKITIWPIVRGYSKEIHLHSWIVLEPVEPVMSRRRFSMTMLSSMDEDGQRQYIRRSVVTETLWRSLGLRWRTESGPEWPYGAFPRLCIEVPVEERNRLPAREARWVPDITPGRVLVLSAPFGHAELIAAFVGEGLGFGTIDLRYQGFPESYPRDLMVRFCREKLADRAINYAWSICEASSTMKLLEDDIINAAEHSLIVGVFYGALTRQLGSQIWGLSSKELLDSSDGVSAMLRKINRRNSVITVDYSEEDYISTAVGGTSLQIDFHLLTDHVRFSAAEILNFMYQHCNGPAVGRWGTAFDDLMHGTDGKAYIPPRASRVQWFAPGQFGARLFPWIPSFFVLAGREQPRDAVARGDLRDSDRPWSLGDRQHDRRTGQCPPGRRRAGHFALRHVVVDHGRPGPHLKAPAIQSAPRHRWTFTLNRHARAVVTAA